MHHHWIRILLIALLAIASLAPIVVQATANANTIKKAADTALKTPAPQEKLTNEQYIASTLPASEVLWLEGESGKFLALKRDYLAARHKGVAIFISDISAPINYNLDIEPLRQSINQYGWTSITIHAPSINLLSAKSSPMSEKSSDASAIGDQKNSSSIDQSHYAKQLIERVVSAQKYAANLSKRAILVVQGRQISYLTNSLIQQHLHPLNAIVIIDAKTAIYDTQSEQYPATSTQLATHLSMLKTPLLDIYHLDNDRTAQEMMLRQQISRKAKQQRYRQYLTATYSKEQHLAKIVYGWLKTLGVD